MFRPRLLAFALALLAAPGLARAAVTMPGCDAVAAYVAQSDLKPVTTIGRPLLNLRLATAVTTPRFTALFGAAALDWTADEAKATARAIAQCARALGHARKRAEARAVGYFARAVGHIGAVRTWLDRANAGFDRQFQALLALPPSRDQLAALLILDHARAGWEAVAQAEAYARKITGTNASRQMHGAPARALSALFTDLRRAPDHLGDRMYPALAEKRDALIPQIAARQDARIDAVPATLAGLQSLPRLRQEIDREIRLILPPPAYQPVAAHIAARAAAIQDAVQADLLAQIAKAPPGGPGMMALDAAETGPALAALSPPRAAAVHAAIASRRDALQDAMTEATIAQIDQFPPTLNGLAQLVGFSRQINANMAPSAGPARIKRVRDATWARARAIATAALPEFQKSLAALTEDRAGLRALSGEARQLNAGLVLMPPPVAAQYKSALAARQSAIQAAVDAADARLEALPLAGATYAGPGGNPTIEFRNASHAYLAITRDNKLDITYETDGHNVILHDLPQGNIVFERHGAALVGGGLHLRRLPG